MKYLLISIAVYAMDILTTNHFYPSIAVSATD
jgi:hypothetical protein